MFEITYKGLKTYIEAPNAFSALALYAGNNDDLWDFIRDEITVTQI